MDRQARPGGLGPARRPAAVLACCAVLVTFAGACGGGEDEAPSPEPTATATRTVPAATPTVRTPAAATETPRAAVVCIEDIAAHAEAVLEEPPMHIDTLDDLDGDGVEETTAELTFAQNRLLAIYLSNGGCPRFGGSILSVYLEVLDSEHNGLRDLEGLTVCGLAGRCRTEYRFEFDGTAYTAVPLLECSGEPDDPPECGNGLRFPEDPGRPFRALSATEVDTRVRPELGPDDEIAGEVLEGPFGPSGSTLFVLVDRGTEGWGVLLLNDADGTGERFEVQRLEPVWTAWGVARPMFEDVDGDGYVEAIVMAEYITGIGPGGAEPFVSNSVLDWDGADLVSLPEIADKIRELTDAGEIRAALSD